MTRDFNKPRRDEHMRPSARHTPSGHSNKEQPFKPARPRLSRDTVDRAWENGANRSHADYRPRQNAPRPPYQSQGRPAPSSGRPQTPQNRPGYGARPESYRGSSPSNYSGGYQQRREQGPDSGRRPFNNPNYRGPANSGYQRREQSFENNRRPFNESEYRRFSSAPDTGNQRNEPEYGERRFNDSGNRAPGFQGERYQRGPAQPYRGGEGRYQDSRPPRAGGYAPRPGGPARNDYRSERGPRSFERGEREGYNRPSGPPPQRDSYNPRWQSRPTAQPGYKAARRERPPYARPTSEQFEGDYEHFDAHQGDRHGEPEEKHVTHLPDGRVLKGSRPSQRKQARFWNEVAEESSTLLSPTPGAETPEQVSEFDTQVEQPTPLKKRPAPKPKEVRTVKTNLARGTGGMKSRHGDKAKALKRKKQGPQTPGTMTRPSKRGYKWPTPGNAGE